METFFFNLGFSYTLSKALPFILFILIGLFLGIFLYKKATKKIWKVLSLIVILIPFTIYFAINPIYQGDFTNEAKTVKSTNKTSELNDKSFVLVAMPGCPYCYQAIGFLKDFKKQNPSVKIDFVVTSTDSKTLTAYKDEINGAFPIHLSKEPLALATLVDGRFPSFVQVENGNSFQIWNNNNFGVRAMDYIVKANK